MKNAVKGPKNRNKGFTLIEILVVLTIMLAMMAMIAGDISHMFSGNDLDQAQRVIEDAFAKARSKAVTLEKNVAIYISYRSLREQPECKLWVVVGAGRDNDFGGALQGLDVDEFDFDKNYVSTKYAVPAADVEVDDNVLPIAYTLPYTVFVHGLQKSMSSTAERGEFIRWYAVFSPDGSCKMIRPDDAVEGAPANEGDIATWNRVNDYLPEYYAHEKGTGTVSYDTVIPLTSAVTSDLTSTTTTEFRTDAAVTHDLKIYNANAERYFMLQRGAGKLVVSKGN